MNQKWQQCEWGDIATLEYGKSLRDYRAQQGRYRVYGTNGPIGWHDKALCTHPGIVVGRKGAYRGIHYSPEPFFVIDTAFYLEPKQAFDLRWAYYCLLTYDINNMDSGSAIPSTSRESFYQLPVLLPSLPEQKAIAAVLSSLDDKIELLRRQNETLEKIAQAIFKEWFVEFNFPDKNGKPYKASGGKMTDSELGRIPAGWRVGPIGDSVKCVGGSTPSTKNPDFWNGGAIPFLTPKDLSQLSVPVVMGAERCVNELGASQISSGVLPADTIVMSSRAPIGYLAVATIPLVINQGIIGMICNGAFPQSYVYGWVQQNMRRIKASAGGSTFDEINKSSFRALNAVVPDTHVLLEHATITKPLTLKLATNARQTAILAKLRDSLLPKLMSGEIRVGVA
ncbi:MAG TPA: restriction endonuclease subunit S [candidate division Zixibacteria bacterium]|nr:restriction endonuclease subunit S [candidate division Zixibacteria bacterium]